MIETSARTRSLRVLASARLRIKQLKKSTRKPPNGAAPSPLPHPHDPDPSTLSGGAALSFEN
jgi:hypothetical protein